mgnify:FL=1
MGTRSVTYIYEMPSLGGKVICAFFRHWDGYPSGHGVDLVNWLEDKSLVNGYTLGTPMTAYNRAGTMAVKLMNHIQDISGCEVIPTDTKEWTHGEEYIYYVTYAEAASKFVVYCRSRDNEYQIIEKSDEFADSEEE